MQWDELLGHEQQREWFQTALSHGRLASSFLFIGPEGIGKHAFAGLLAQSLLCSSTPAAELSHCGTCESCVQVVAGTHPDLLYVSKPADRANIPLDLLIGSPEKRMREGLCHDISTKPFRGSRKIAILDDADSLNAEGANCLLKTLEEPPSHALIILIGTSLPRQLPTIRSRCQTILFRPLDEPHLAELLLREQIVDSHAAADELAAQAAGNLADARRLLDQQLRDFRHELLRSLCQERIPMVELAKQCGTVVNAAGKDARVRRDRMKLILRFAAEFFRGVALCLSAPDPDKIDSRAAASLRLDTDAILNAARHWRKGLPQALACWQSCLVAMQNVDRNANQTALLEAWAADVARSSGH